MLNFICFSLQLEKMLGEEIKFSVSKRFGLDPHEIIQAVVQIVPNINIFLGLTRKITKQ